VADAEEGAAAPAQDVAVEQATGVKMVWPTWPMRVDPANTETSFGC
jgi:hypothetical protein